MKLTVKEISIVLVFSVLYSIIAVWLVGFTTAIAYPNWMQTLIAEVTTPDRNVRAMYMYIWEILVVHFVGAGIPFIVVLCGLFWSMKKISYSVPSLFISIYLVFSLFVIPLFYGGFVAFSFTFYLLLQPALLLLCALLVVAYFKPRHFHTDSMAR